MAIKNDGTLWTWGRNYYGEIGIGDKLSRNSPQFISYPSNILNIYSGFGESALLDINKDKICMAGSNSNWQLGDSTTTDHYTFECGKFLQSVLAVTVTNLKAYEINNQIKINWDVAVETNILKYDVEKSLNGIDFQKLGSVYPKNHYSGAASYTWSDISPQKGNNFYRIKFFDGSGDEKITSIVKVKISSSNAGISCYPNPITDNSINLNLESLPKGNYSIRLINILGQTMMLKKIEYFGGSFYQSIKIANSISKGFYHLIVESDENRYTLPIIIN